jgi:hypothetical protein
MFLTPASPKMLWMELTCRPRRGRDSQLLVPASTMPAKINSTMTFARRTRNLMPKGAEHGNWPRVAGLKMLEPESPVDDWGL